MFSIGDSDIWKSPEAAFTEATERLISKDRLFALTAPFYCGIDHSLRHRLAFEKAWAHKGGYKGGKWFPWGRWLTECIFPEQLYEDNGYSLSRLVADDRFWYKPVFSKIDSYHSHIGRMARPRRSGGQYYGFLDYTIDRWKRANHRSMPHFYFDVESPEWIWEELMANPNQIKTGRSATTCTANFCFRWDTINKRLVFYQILKHSQYSHIYGDFCGSAAFVRAFCDEVGLNKDEAVVVLFAITVSMDGKKQAKQYLEGLG